MGTFFLFVLVILLLLNKLYLSYKNEINDVFHEYRLMKKFKDQCHSVDVSLGQPFGKLTYLSMLWDLDFATDHHRLFIDPRLEDLPVETNLKYVVRQDKKLLVSICIDKFEFGGKHFLLGNEQEVNKSIISLLLHLFVTIKNI